MYILHFYVACFCDTVCMLIIFAPHRRILTSKLPILQLSWKLHEEDLMLS